MKMNLKLCLLVLTSVFSGQSLIAITLGDLRGLEFDTVTTTLKTKATLVIAGKGYTIREELPKLYSAIHQGEVHTNPCYPESLGIGPTLLTTNTLEHIPAGIKFNLLSFREDEFNEFLTISFTAENNPHWQDGFSSPVPMDKRYWSEDHTAGWAPLRYVSFLLQKRS